jgi:preprotein translocase SecE subunit
MVHGRSHEWAKYGQWFGMQHQRQVLLIFVALAVLTGITLNAAVASLLERLSVVDYSLLGIFPGSALAAVVGGVGVFFGLLRNPAAVAYADEVVDEMSKVTWPSRDEAVRGATTVVLATLFMAALIGGYDVLWKTIALYLYR